TITCYLSLRRCLSSIFFFQRYVNYPALLSFPTRRSSDLAAAGPCVAGRPARNPARPARADRSSRHRAGCPLLHRTRCRPRGQQRSEEHTSELQSRENLVCRLLLEKKK